MRSERIIIIDDSSKSIQRTTSALREIGFDNVSQYFSAAEFLESTVVELDINLIISDIVMPGVTGIELAQELKSQGRGEVKILLMSIEKSFDYIEHDLGIPYMHKPYRALQFIRAIQAKVQEILG